MDPLDTASVLIVSPSGTKTIAHATLARAVPASWAALKLHLSPVIVHGKVAVFKTSCCCVLPMDRRFITMISLSMGRRVRAIGRPNASPALLLDIIKARSGSVWGVPSRE